VWFMRRRANVCGHCATGCSIFVEENQDHVYRIKPRENPHVNQWWICDEGRYGYHHVHSPERLVGARRQDERGATVLEWDAALAELAPRLGRAGRLAGVLSPHLTVEEAYLLARYLRQLDSEAALALGPVPIVGQDERFKNGFVIHAEKCPNRRGVEAIVAQFMGNVLTFDELLPRIEAGEFGGLWVTGGYREPWIDEATAARAARAGLLVVQDLFDSPLWRRATYQLPGVAYPERAGSYVNYQGRLQSFSWSVRPPEGDWIEGHVYWRLLGRQGLYDPRSVLAELAAEIPSFAAAAEPVPPTGVQLETPELAASK
jgi:NADH-quinone oxidoreductase subunit G